MDKCKNCGTEEQGGATLLDKRGYCYKPYCQSRSYDEVEQQDSCIRFELDRQIKINRKLVEALKEIADTETCTEEYGLKCAYHFHKLAKETLKEINKTNEFKMNEFITNTRNFKNNTKKNVKIA